MQHELINRDRSIEELRRLRRELADLRTALARERVERMKELNTQRYEQRNERLQSERELRSEMHWVARFYVGTAVLYAGLIAIVIAT